MYGIDPDADPQALVLEPGQHAGRVGEGPVVPLKSHQWNSRIQKQSKWNTDSGRSRSAMPSTKSVTVSSS